MAFKVSYELFLYIKISVVRAAIEDVLELV